MHSIWYYIFFGFVLAQFASFLTTVYLHRGLTHRAVIFSPVAQFFAGLGLWLTTGIKPKEWVAIHRYHHAHTDVEGDPHSPFIQGFWAVQLGNIFLYEKAAKNPKVLWYSKDLELDWAERNLFRSKKLGLAIGIAALCSIFGIVPGLVIAGTHTVLYLFVLNNLINGLCHARGYKNFPDTPAFNNRFVALVTGGEGLHNNHHHDPWRASLSRKWNEIDPGWIFIKALCKLGLAKVPSPI